jgi:hypothetical protein
MERIIDGINELIELAPILRNARMELELIQYHEYIVNERERGTTYRKIVKTLKENGITVSTKTIQRFIRRKRAENNKIHP